MSEQARSQRQSNLRIVHGWLLLSTCLVLCQGFSFQSPRPRLSSVRRSSQDDLSQAYETSQPNGGLDDEEDVIPDDVPDNLPAKQIEELMKKQTLYDLLGASKKDTRAEIKKNYLIMAKKSHPDAQIGGNGTIDGQAPDFGEISQAWRVLGDQKTRLRYDRSLQAAAFSENAQRMANERLEKAVPVISKMLDKVALPFLRRTTATSIAVAQAAKNGFTKKENKENTSGRKDKGFDAFFDAIAAGQRAGKMVDSLELTEKCVELEARAEEERELGKRVQQELNRITEQRLFATLQSPNVALSSDEARLVLSKLGPNEEASLLGRALLKKSILEEIDDLTEAEASFSEKLNTYEETDSQWNSLLSQQENAKVTLSNGKLAEIEARKALERALRLVADAKDSLVLTSKALRAVEQQVRKNAAEMDTVTNHLSKNQERVRNALKKKSEMVMAESEIKNLTEEDLAVLCRKEIRLVGESEQIELMVARLSSRAEKLRMRAIALERWQQNGFNGANNSTAMGL